MANLLSTTVNGSLLALNNGAAYAYTTASNGRLYLGSNTQNDYSIYTHMEDFNGNYTKLTLDWHTGIKIGASKTYGGIRFYNDAIHNGGAKLFSIGQGDDHVRVEYNLYVGGGTTSGDITVSGNSAGVYFTGGNNRIYFAGARAIEGNGTNLQIGEGHSQTQIQSSTTRVDGNTVLNNYVRINKDWAGGDYGAEQLTIRGTYPSIALRNTGNNIKWLIHHDSTGNLQFYQGGPVDDNNWSKKIDFASDGNIYSAYYGDWLSNIFNSKQNASTAINTSNIGSQSVSYATRSEYVSSNQWSSSTANEAVRVVAPAGASASWDGGITGAFRIKLPQRANNTMWTMKIRIYNYAGNQTSEYTLGNYSYDQGGYNASAQFTGSANATVHNVRFGNQDGVDCVWIGEVNTSWSYPVISVIDFTGGFRNGNAATWQSGWNITYVTSFGTVASTIYPDTRVGNIYASSSMRAPIFYDSENTEYYLDPAGTSNLLKFSDRTMGFNDMNPMSANSPYESRYNGSVNYRTGSMGYASVDLNAIGSNWGSGFIDSWSSPANQPNGSTTHWVGFQSIHYGHQNSSNFYGFQMVSGADTNRFYVRASWPNPLSWLEMITTGNIGSQSVSYASSAGNADTVDGFHASYAATANSIPTRDSDGYLAPEAWIRLNGAYGLYSPTNNAHFYPNDGSYGSWKILGSRNSYRGLQFASGTNGDVSLMIHENSNITGFHNAVYDWQFYWSGGTLYCFKNTYGGGTQATVLDSSNYGSYSQFSGKITVGTFSQSQTNTGEAWIGRAADRAAGTLTVQLGTGTGRSFEVVDYGWNTVVFQANDDGNAYAASSFRAPIFYDSQDTNYYVDPNGTSRLNGVNAPQGYVSIGNPWGTANSAYFPNGITTAGNDNWIYGHTYIGNAPSNGNGHEFWTNGNSHSSGTVTIGGNVGIGTTSPLNKLSVVKSNGFGYYNRTDALAVFQSVSPTVLIAHDGNAPNEYAELKLGNNQSTYYPYSAYIRGVQGSGIDQYRLEFGTAASAAATTKMTIAFNGNVGIGTTSPAYKLDVSGGAIAIRGNAPGNSLRFDDTTATSRNAMYVDTSNYLNIGNANYAGVKFVQTASAPNSGAFDGQSVQQAIGTTDEGVVLAAPDAWLAVRVGTTDYAIPMYTTG